MAFDIRFKKSEKLTSGSAKMVELKIDSQTVKVDQNLIDKAHRSMGDKIYVAVDADGTIMAHKFMVRAGNVMWRSAHDGKADSEGVKSQSIKIGYMPNPKNWKTLLQIVKK